MAHLGFRMANQEIKPLLVRTETPFGVLVLDYLRRVLHRVCFLRGWSSVKFTIEDIAGGWLQARFMIPDLSNGGTGDDVPWQLDCWINARSQFEFSWCRLDSKGTQVGQVFSFIAPLSFVLAYSSKQFARWVEARLAGHAL